MLFAAYAVLFLWSQNLGDTDPRDVVLPLVVLIGGAGLLTWIVGRVLGDRRRGALVVSPMVVGLLMYGHADEYADRLGIPGFVQQAAWVGIVLVGVVLAVRLGTPTVARLDTFLGRIAAILVAIALVLIVSFEAPRLVTAAPAPPSEPQADTTSAPKRDVYWLVFDRYGSDRALDLRFGPTDSLTPWLREAGFTVLEDSHANYVRTALSMMTTLEMSHLDALAAQEGPDSPDMGPVYERLQSPLVARQFQELGYRYFHIGSWWGPTREIAGADVSLHAPGPSDFVSALFEASAVPAAAKRLGLETILGDQRQSHFVNNEYGLGALDDLVDEPGPKFVLGHVLLPHPPYVFDRDGSFVPVEVADERPIEEEHQRQLDYTNARLRAFLERLLALPEAQRPIIILQGDEGPWTARYHAATRRFDWDDATPEELEAKFGILNAWYVPGDVDLDLYPAMTAINTFPTLFSGYFGLDYPRLPDTIRSSETWRRPYDLTDITDRLPSLD
jgi:hypothetical protein